MAIALLTGPANAGKARAVLDRVRAHAARGREPWLVVPTHADVERYRRELAEGGLVLGVRVERFQGLLAEVIRRSENPPRPERALSPLQRERVVAALAARGCSGRDGFSERGGSSERGGLSERGGFSDLAGRPGYVRALVELISELEVERITPARLRAALASCTPAAGARTQELSDIFAGYRDLQRELGRADPDRLSARALDAVRRAPALWGGTPVLLYGFDDLTRLQLDAIETLGRVADAPVTVALAYEPGRVAFAGRAGAFQTLLPWAVEHRTLPARAEHYAPGVRRALHHLERGLFEGDEVRVSPAGAVRLLEGGSPRAELELVAGEIRALLDAGTPPAEVALAHRSPRAVAELLEEVLGAFEIPFALARALPFSHTALGRALCGLLACACGESARLEDLLAWLRAPGLLERPELADRLEAVARRRGITSAAAARALWESEHWPLLSIDQIAAAARQGPPALLARATRELRWLFGAPRRHAAAVLDGEQLAEAAALRAGMRALGELTELARSTSALGVTAAELVTVLENLELDVGDPPGVSAEDAVAVLDPLALRARRVRALFLCGLQEGLFPGPARPLPILGEEERRALASSSGLRLAMPAQQTLATERYLFYAAVSRPQELLVLSWHTATEEGGSATPSLFIDDVCDLFPPDLRELRARRPAGAASWPGPGARPPVWAEREQALAGPHVAPPTLRPLTDPQLLAELRHERLWSASSLKLWADCPARWFVERLLRGADLDPDPEPLARGGLAHAALRTTLEGLRERTGSARLEPERLELARELLHEALEEHARDFPLSVAPERRLAARRRLEADLERYLEHAAGTAAETSTQIPAEASAPSAAEAPVQSAPLEPLHLELGFGFPEDPEPLPPLDLGGGLRLRGRIDRVDVGVGGDGIGRAVVYDYKGALAPPADRWVGERSLQIALYMRAVQELLQMPVAGGFYQPLAGRDLRARGLLAADGEVQLQCVRGDAREPGEVRDIAAELLALAREAACEADAGALEGRPGTCAFAGGCMYPSICRCEP